MLQGLLGTEWHLTGRKLWICLIASNKYKDFFKDIFDYFNISGYTDALCKKKSKLLFFFFYKLIVMESIYGIDIWIAIIHEFVMYSFCIFVENVDSFYFILIYKGMW